MGSQRVGHDWTTFIFTFSVCVSILFSHIIPPSLRKGRFFQLSNHIRRGSWRMLMIATRQGCHQSGAWAGCSGTTTPPPWNLLFILPTLVCVLKKNLYIPHQLHSPSFWLPVGFSQWETAASGQKEGLERSGYHSLCSLLEGPCFGSCSIFWPCSVASEVVHPGNSSIPSGRSAVASPRVLHHSGFLQPCSHLSKQSLL